MIATTYTFINRVADNNQLEIIEEQPIEQVQEVVDEDTTTTSTTTTTLPSNYVEYLEEITAEKIQATELGKEVLEANENWDAQSVSYRKQRMSLELLLKQRKTLLQQYLNLVHQMNLQI